MLDKYAFMKDFLRISSKGTESEDGNSNIIIPLVPNKVQKLLIDNKTSRNVILKARQHGCSTGIIADYFIDTITIPGLTSVVVSHTDFATKRLFNKARMFYDLCPEKNFFPIASRDAENLLYFDKLKSSYYVATAKAKVILKGDTVHRLHLSELAFYDMSNPGRAQDILEEAHEVVPIKHGVLIVESTPNYKNDTFYNLYFGAKYHHNNYKAFFFPWWFADDYKIKNKDVPEGFERDKDENIELTEEEKDLIFQHNLNNDQIRWRRFKIREQGNKFWRQHPENDASCWVNPESMIFDKDAIDRLMRQRIKPLDFRPVEQMFIWETPDKSEVYVVGADVAEGLMHGNYSTASIVKVSNGTEVAHIRGKFPVEVCAAILARVGKEYNNALIGVEINQHGMTVLNILNRIGYPNMYWASDDKGRPQKLGWSTNVVTRPQMIDEFDRALRVGSFRTSCEDLISEIQDFALVNGKAQAPDGSTDDSLFAAMIAWMIRNDAVPVNTIANYATRYG